MVLSMKRDLEVGSPAFPRSANVAPLSVSRSSYPASAKHLRCLCVKLSERPSSKLSSNSFTSSDVKPSAILHAELSGYAMLLANDPVEADQVVKPRLPPSPKILRIKGASRADAPITHVLRVGGVEV